MKIVRNETTKEIAGIGAVAFEAFESTRGTYWHEQYGRTHSQAFRFTAEGREYWGTITRTFDRNGKPGARTFFDVELRTRFSGSTHSRALPETAKAAWRRALIQHFKAELETFNAARDAETGAPSLSLDNMHREEPATAADEAPALPAEPDAIQTYEMRSDGCQAAGAIVLRRLPGNDATPYVVHFRNNADSLRTGRPCYYSGDYCANLADAWQAFGEKVSRYDPAGALGVA